MFIALCVMTGDESGSLSASVEWCSEVQARLKSRPRECRGMEVAGEPDCDCGRYIVLSSWGESGAARGRFVLEGKCEGEGMLLLMLIPPLPIGIWRDSPRERKSGRRDGRGRGVTGETAASSWSSLLCTVSRNVGEGWRGRGALAGSDNERDLDGVLLGESGSDGGGRSIVMSMAPIAIQCTLNHPVSPSAAERGRAAMLLLATCR